MKLATYVDRYLLAREVCHEYAAALRSVEREFSRWLKRPATTKDLFDDQVNRWLADMCQANGRAKVTLANKRCMVLVLWRAAWIDGHCKQPPKRIRKISVPAPVTVCWDAAEVKRLLKAADKMPGRFKRSRVSRAKFWRAFILAGYYSGLRLGDLCRLRWSDVRRDGSVAVVQHKTQTGIVGKIRPNGLAAMRAIRAEKRQRVFGDCLSRQRIMRQFVDLVRRAGLAGGTKMLRRTGATLLEIDHPGWAQEHLGHKTPGIAARHYIDHAKLQRRKPTPRRID